MNILLTGCGGQLGRALSDGLTRLGSVAATDIDTLDLADAAALGRELDRLRPRLIVNAAAYTDVETAELQRAAAFRINAEAPAALAAWAAANDAALLHYSTDYVYDGSGAMPWDESADPAPLNVYGESKLAGDRAILASGAAALILRTSWLYASSGRNFVLTMLRLGAERTALKIVDDQVGAPTSAALLAGISLSILAMAQGDPAGLFRQKGGVVHAAASGETSWHGFAQAIFAGARARGMRLAVECVEPILSAAYAARATRPMNSRLGLDRLRLRFGIEPQHWRDALDEVLDSVARNGAEKAQS